MELPVVEQPLCRSAAILDYIARQMRLGSEAALAPLGLLTPDDVCALLKVKKSWLYDAVEDGAIETIRLGKQLRFRPSALLRYLDKHAINANGQ